MKYMLLKGFPGLGLVHLRQPGVVGLHANNRGVIAAVGAIGFHHLHLPLQSRLLYHVPEKPAQVFAAFLLALAARAHINHFIGYMKILAHVGFYGCVKR